MSGSALGDILQTLNHRPGLQPVNVPLRIKFEVHFDAALVPETVPLAHRLRHDQDVAEKNGGIEIKPADGLERDFGGEFRGLHQFKKGVVFLQRAIFRQGAPGLAHQPDRRTIHRRQWQALRNRSRLPSGRAASSSQSGRCRGPGSGPSLDNCGIHALLISYQASARKGWAAKPRIVQPFAFFGIKGGRLSVTFSRPAGTETPFGEPAREITAAVASGGRIGLSD